MEPLLLSLLYTVILLPDLATPLYSAPQALAQPKLPESVSHYMLIAAIGSDKDPVPSLLRTLPWLPGRL